MRGIYYGWPMLFLLSVAQVTSWGVLYYSFAVFLTPMRAEFGWSTATLTGAYSLALLLSGIAAVPVGRWLDRHGPRALMSLGSCVAFALVLAWAAVETLWTYYLVWAAIGVTMATVLYEPAFQVVAVWFRRTRARALTLLTFIGGFASVIYLPLANWLVNARGWREALVILAVIVLAGTLPIHAFALRRDPSAIGLAPDGEPSAEALPQTRVAPPGIAARYAMRDPAFWWLAAAFVLATLATMAITVHLIPYLVSAGYSPAFAAGAAGLIGALALPGRLIFTPLGAKVSRRYITVAIFLLQTLSLVVLALAGSRLAIFVFVALFGAGFGAITPARAALVADMYGAANYGSINGVLAMCITFARAVAPVGAGVLATSVGYTPMLWALVVASTLGTAAALKVRPTVPPVEERTSIATAAGAS